LPNGVELSYSPGPVNIGIVKGREGKVQGGNGEGDYTAQNKTKQHNLSFIANDRKEQDFHPANLLLWPFSHDIVAILFHCMMVSM